MFTTRYHKSCYDVSDQTEVDTEEEEVEVRRNTSLFSLCIVYCLMAVCIATVGNILIVLLDFN